MFRHRTIEALSTALFLAALTAIAPPAHAGPGPTPAASNRMTVHEWGTFTALQNESGEAIGGINTDDEPLPVFVHNLRPMLMQTPSEVPAVYFKGAPRCHPDVIARLETPVIYFHPPASPSSAPSKIKLDVEVQFRGGWLTQFYPDATTRTTGDAARADDANAFDFGHITPQTVGSLSWPALQVGGAEPGPQTDSPVWLAPRKVDCASVTAVNGEAERYLFYRGVGKLKSPLLVSRDAENSRLQVRSRFSELGDDFKPGKLLKANVGPLWLVDVRAGGACAFTTLDSVDASQGDQKVLANLPAWFEEADYSMDNLAALRKSFSSALVRDGLNADEAEALLNTWEASYFKRPGLRLFFLAPRQWTDFVLPLRITGVPAADITRVMVGRIEIVTPAQRQLLKQISDTPSSNARWLDAALVKANAGREDYYREQWYQQVLEGTKLLSSMNLEMPEDYRAYLGLGRFRNALILDEAAHNPSGYLNRFIENYELAAYKVGE
jgi:hypothetical protein